MKISSSMLADVGFFALSCFPALAQQVTGEAVRLNSASSEINDA
jgi:hypothetical protein